MPTFIVTAPNGKEYQVDTPPGGTEQDAIRYIAYKLQYEPTQQDSTVVGELGRGLEKAGSAFHTTFDSFGDSKAANARIVEGVQRGDKIDEKYGAAPTLQDVTNTYDKKGILSAAGQVVKDAPRVVAGQAGNMAVTTGGQLAGAAIGNVIPVVGPVVGGFIGGTAASFPLNYASNLERQAQEQIKAGKRPEEVDVSRGTAAVAAAGQSAVDSATNLFVMGKALIKGMLGISEKALASGASAAAEQALLKTAQRSLAGTVARGTIKGGAIEPPTEVLQQVIERAQAGLPLLSPDAMKEYGETAYQSFLTGNVTGGAGNVVERRNARGEITRIKENIQGPQPPAALAKTPEARAYAEALQKQKEIEDARKAAEQAPPESETPAPSETAPLAQPETKLELVPKEENVPAETEATKQAPPEAASGIIDTKFLTEAGFPGNLKAAKEFIGLDFNDPAVVARIAELHRKYAENYEGSNADRRAKLDAFEKRLQGILTTEEKPQEVTPNVPPVSTTTGKPEVNRTVEPGPVEPSVPVVEQPAATERANSTEQTTPGTEPAPVGVSESPVVPDNAGKADSKPAITRTEPTGNDILRAWGVVREAERHLNYMQKVFDKISAVKASFTPEYQNALKKLVEAQQDYEYKVQNAQDIANYRKTQEEAITPEEKIPVGTQVGVRGDKGIKSGFIYGQPNTKPVNPKQVAYSVTDAVKLAEALDKFSNAIPTNVYDDTVQAWLTDTGGRVKQSPEAIRAVQDVLATYADQKKLQDFVDGPVEAKEGHPNELGYPYNLTDPEVLFDEVRHWVPTHSPEYSQFVDKHVNDDFKLKDTKAARTAAHALLKKHTALLNPARNIPFVGDPELTAKVRKAIEGKPLHEAIQNVGKLFNDPAYHHIAQKVAARLQSLQNVGMKVELKVVKAGDRAPAAILGSRGLTVTNFNKGKGTNVTVYIPDESTQHSGMHPEFVLHEGVHAATAFAMHIGGQEFAKGTVFQEFTDGIKALQKHVVAEMERRVRSDPTGKAYPVERAFLNTDKYNFTKDHHELVAWALSNEEAKVLLESIPYKQSRAWTWFTNAIRNLFGLEPKYESAFSEILNLSGALLDTNAATLKNVAALSGYPIAFENAAIADPSTNAAVQYLDVIGEKPKPKSLATRTIESFGSEPIMAARVRVADNMASLADKLSRTYGGQRNQFGELNPEQIARQAVDYGRMDTAAKQFGGLFFTADKMAFADKLTVPNDPSRFPLTHGQEVSEVLIVKKLHEFAKAENITYDHADKNLSTLEYGHREFNLREFNRDLTRQQQQIANSNNPNAAKLIADLEAKKIDLRITDNLALDDIERKYQASVEAKTITEMKDAVRYNRIDMLVQSGRISEEMAQTWKDAVGYVPFDRLMDWTESVTKRNTSARGLAALKSIKDLNGSARQVSSTTDSFMKFSSWAVKEALKNNAMREATRPLEMIGAVRQGTKPRIDAPGDVYSFYRDGEHVDYYTPDPFLFAAFVEGNDAPGYIVKWFQKAAQLTRVGITATPPFALKQVAEDITRAMFYSGVNKPLSLIPKVVKNFVAISASEFQGKHSKGTLDMRKQGVVGTYDFEASNTIRNIQIEAGVKKRTLTENIIHYGEVMARASDLAVRQAVYDQTIKEGGDKTLAEQRARELINFSRRGASKYFTTIARTVPFFNAYVQGTDKLVRIIQGVSTDAGLPPAEARSIFLRRATVMAGMATLYAMSMAGNDEYEEMPEIQRNLNWVIPGARSLGFTAVVPVPREIGIFAKSIPEAVVNYYKTQGTKDEKRAVQLIGALLRLGRDTFIANPLAAGYKPILEWVSNYSFFLGRPLESQAQLQLQAFAREGLGTSQFAKDLALLLEEYTPSVGGESIAHKGNASPIRLENTIRGIFGTTAAMLIGAYDTIRNPNSSSRPLHRAMASQISGLSTFMRDPVGTQFIEELYGMNEEATQTYNTFNKLVKEHPERAAAYAEQHMPYYAIYKITQSTVRDLGHMRDIIKLIERAPGITPTEKRAKIDDIRRAEVAQASIVRDLRKVLTQMESKQ